LPTVKDLTRELGALQIPELVKVQGSFHHGDVWMQDQFKEFFWEAGPGPKRGVLHFPRVHAKEKDGPKKSTPQSNHSRRGLADLVERHFHQSGVEVLDDLRKPSFRIREEDGQDQHLPFEEAADLYTLLWRVRDLGRLASMYLVDRAQRSHRNAREDHDFSQAYRKLPRLVKQAERRLLSRKSTENSRPSRRILARRARDLANRLREITSVIRLNRQGPVNQFFIRHGGKTLTLTDPSASALYRTLAATFGSENRGGNIEVAPAMPNQSHGKLIVGARAGNSPGNMGKSEISSFLLRRCTQPVLEVDTSWLRVGHVDEILSVISNRKNEKHFAILCASPHTALHILEEAANLYRSGLTAEHPHFHEYEFKGRDFRRTTDGRFPVTWLFRGRNWVHQHERNSMKPLEPPQIYQAMAMESARSSKPARLPFSPGAGARALYPAGMSVLELLHFEDGGNAEMEHLFLTPMKRRLRAEFPKARILPLPVLFDRVRAPDHVAGQHGSKRKSLKQDFYRRGIALTPNLVNLQALGTRLVLPRPHGPRMRPNDAVSVIRRVIASWKLDLPLQFDGSFDNLTDVVYWVVADRRHVSDIASEFCDGFPGVSVEEVAKRILRANRWHFDPRGYLKRGWRRLIIPEHTVDLFELFAHITAVSLGLQARFVEAWYYHARHGGLHCATNVMRRLPSNPKC
jgi:hypothetical protein